LSIIGKRARLTAQSLLVADGHHLEAIQLPRALPEGADRSQSVLTKASNATGKRRQRSLTKATDRDNPPGQLTFRVWLVMHASIAPVLPSSVCAITAVMRGMVVDGAKVGGHPYGLICSGCSADAGSALPNRPGHFDRATVRRSPPR